MSRESFWICFFGDFGGDGDDFLIVFLFFWCVFFLRGRGAWG